MAVSATSGGNRRLPTSISFSLKTNGAIAIAARGTERLAVNANATNGNSTHRSRVTKRPAAPIQMRPISARRKGRWAMDRSEERRVGKECRARRWRDDEGNKKLEVVVEAEV